MAAKKKTRVKLLAHCWRCGGPIYIGDKTTGCVDTTAPDNRVRHFSCAPWISK